MIKVLEIFAEPISNGGQESIVMNVLKAIDRTDMIIDVATPYYCDNNYYKDIIKQISGKLYCWELPFRPGKSRFFYIKLVREFLNRHPYDVIHIHSGSVSALAYMAYAAKKAGVKKIVVHSHASGTENIKHFVLKKLMGPIFLISATDYCACSVLAADFKFPHSVVKKKCNIIKNGIDTSLFKYNKGTREEIRKNLGISETTFVVGHVGRFSIEKNHVFLVNVFAEIKKQNVDSKLILIGSGEEEENIKNKIEQFGLKENVIFVGNVNDVYNYMQAMDVFVQPSLFEGFSIVALEAQGVGLPVVLSDIIPKEVAITDNVQYIPLESSYKEWADKIIKCKGLERKDTREQIVAYDCDIRTTAEIIRNIYLGK